MLYVVATDRRGRVQPLYPCAGGIDQAIGYIASALTHPEEDWASSCDLVWEHWGEAVEEADARGGAACEYFAISRSSYSFRYGLTEL